MRLLNIKFYRSLFPNKTFVKSDGKWIDIKNYKKGKITEVDGKWETQAFCSSCKNELVHSNSFLKERLLKTYSVFDYKCSSCGKTQYWNPDIIPGLLECNESGVPL